MERYAISGKYVSLRPLAKADFELLYYWHTDLRSLHLWQVEREISSFTDFVTDFERRLRRSIDTCFILCSTATNQAVGFVYNYKTNYRDQITYCCVYLSPENVRSGYGLEAGDLFGDYLFRNCGFRKVYAEIFDYNTLVLRLANWLGFREEGCLKAYRWYDNKYWDLHLLALNQQTFFRKKRIGSGELPSNE